MEQHSETGVAQAKNHFIVIEEAETGFSAYSPDLPGCASTGKTLDETERNMREAVEFHIQGLREEGYEIRSR